MTTKQKVFSEKETSILKALANADKPMTLKEIGDGLVSGNINGLVKGGYVAKGENVKVKTPYMAPVKVYNLGANAPTENDKITETLKKVLDLLKTENDLSLEQISDRLGCKVVSGNVNGAVAKGYLDNSKEIEVVRYGMKPFSTYVITDLGLQSLSK